MPNLDLESPPDAPPPSSLEYVRASAPVTRRQFRFLLVLTLLNTILLATFICGPTVSQLVRSNWQQYQARQRIRQQQQAQNALLQQAGQFTAPPDQIIYEENPLDAAALWDSTRSTTSPSNSPYKPINQARVPWQVPLMLADPPVLAQLRTALATANDAYGTLFLHTLKKKDGQERLVWVIIRGNQQNQGPRAYFLPGDLNHSLRQVCFKTKRDIIAMIIQQDRNQSPPDLKLVRHVRLVPDMLDSESTATWKAQDTSEKPVIEAKGVMRFYAGQLDPADPSHFTIDYVYRGIRNTIDVHLLDDDTIVFGPRDGTIDRNEQDGVRFWYPFTATRPSRQ